MFSCPLCCNTVFDTKQSLLNHLTNINEGLVCPICKAGASTLEDLIAHLKCDCMDTVVVEENNFESTGYDVALVNSEMDENSTIATENNTMDMTEVNSLYTEILNNQNVQEVKLVQESEDRYVLIDNNNAMINCGGVTVVSQKNDDGSVTFSIEEPESQNVQEVVETKAETDSQNSNPSDAGQEIYSCNKCAMTFTSVIDHIQNYHNDQDVVVEDATDSTEMESQQSEQEERQTTRRMITETGDIIENTDLLQVPVSENNTATETQVKSSPKPKRKYVRMGKVTDAVVNNNYTPKEGEVKCYKVVMKTIVAPNGSSVKVYSCIDCNYLVSSLKEIKNHPCKKKLTPPKYSCNQCTATYDNAKSLCAHMKVHKEKSMTFSCPHCSEVFENPNSLSAHLNDHKRESGVFVTPTKFECEICNTTFLTSKSLKLHKRMHDPVKPRPIQPPVAADIKTSSDKFLCGICMKVMPIDYRTIHQNSHKNTDELTCDLCNKKFPSKEYLDMHMNVHNTYMNKVSSAKQENESHAHQCLYCERKFARPHEKVKHERIHTGEKPHGCEICGKTFRVSYCLTLHMRTHTGARPYHCPHCPKKFKAHSVYNHHILTHSNVRAYKCPYCPKSFKTSVQLAGHKNSHTKPFSCQQCNRPFASLYAVRVHMEVHTRENSLKFKCRECGASYARAFALKDHMKQAHADQTDANKVDIEADGKADATAILPDSNVEFVEGESDKQIVGK